MTAASASQPAQPVNVWSLLDADPERVITDVRQQLAELAAKVVLVHLAVRRHGDQDLAECRLE